MIRSDLPSDLLVLVNLKVYGLQSEKKKKLLRKSAPTVRKIDPNPNTVSFVPICGWNLIPY
jgi:hypothetical protein